MSDPSPSFEPPEVERPSRPEPAGPEPAGPESAAPDPAEAPDYPALVRFLLEPLLTAPEALSVDCEVSERRSRVWVRVAFQAEDRGRVFGRNGRTIQAVRAVLEAAAKPTGYAVFLDVYGGDERDERPHPRPPKPRPRSAPPRKAPDRDAPDRDS